MYYQRFYEDYREFEKLATFDIFGLTAADDPAQEEGEAADPLKLKVPKKFLEFYDSVAEWLTQRRK